MCIYKNYNVNYIFFILRKYNELINIYLNKSYINKSYINKNG